MGDWPGGPIFDLGGYWKWGWPWGRAMGSWLASPTPDWCVRKRLRAVLAVGSGLADSALKWGRSADKGLLARERDHERLAGQP